MEGYSRFLPHWRVEGATYFVTWRLNPKQSALDPNERTIVANAILFFDGTRYTIHCYVVMDDHVHVLLTPLVPWTVEKIVHSWKSFSAHEIQRHGSHSGTIWQREYFDRIVRDEAEMTEKGNYILGNPIKRWPEIKDYQWAELGKIYR